jgi:hypothetical protein
MLPGRGFWVGRVVPDEPQKYHGSSGGLALPQRIGLFRADGNILRFALCHIRSSVRRPSKCSPVSSTVSVRWQSSNRRARTGGSSVMTLSAA